jgi:hypothetical protein
VVEGSAELDWVCTKCGSGDVIKCDPSVGKCGCVSENKALKEREVRMCVDSFFFLCLSGSMSTSG